MKSLADPSISLLLVPPGLRHVLLCGLISLLGTAAFNVSTGWADPLSTSAFPAPAPADTNRFAAARDTAASRAPTPDQDDQERQRLQVGTLVQTLLHAARGPTSSPEGFHVARARLEAEGQFDASLSYEVEADFADDALLKDARIAYRPTPHLTLGAGRFKVPFSHGELVSSSETDFVQRPRAVRQLSVGRRTGLDVAYQTQDERLQLRGGVFNGEDDPTTAGAPREWLYATRLSWTATTQGVRSIVGLNTTYARRSDTTRVRYGVDIRLTRGRSFLTTEVLAAPNDPMRPSTGAYVTAGYALSASHTLRAQWDYLHTDVPAVAPSLSQTRSLIGIGYTLLLAAPLRIEVDYLAPPTADAFDQSAVFANVQVSL